MARPKLLQVGSRILWGRLVDYVNEAPKFGEKQAWELVFFSGGISRLYPPPGWNELEDVSMRLAQHATPMQALVACLAEYRPRFENLLRWLADPFGEPNRGKEAVAFLNECRGKERALPLELEEKFPARGGTRPRLFSEDFIFHTIAAPICHFIRFRVDLYHHDQSSLAEAVPVRICPRCSKLFVPERMGRKGYCSSVCAALQGQTELKEAGTYRHYIWLLRLEKRLKDAPAKERREKLAERKVRNRLREINKEHPKLAARAQALLKAAK